MHKPIRVVGFKKFRRKALRILPLYCQIQGEVVVGTKNGDNPGGSSYLCLLKIIGLISTWFI